MRSAGTHLLIAFLVAFLVRGTAYATPRVLTPQVYAGKGSVRLLVVVAPLDARAKALLGLVEHSAEAAVDSSDRFDVMRGVDAFDPAAARARYDKASEAANLANQAKKALEDLDSATATKQYAAALAAWKQADLTKGIDGLIEAQIGKAAGHSVSEENPQAKQEIERALVLAPKTKLSDAQFPPELLKFAETRRTAFRNAKGKLTVRTEPPGARLWVDGAYRGPSPVTVEQLAPGEKHLVVAALSGFSMAVEEVGTGEQLVKLKAAEMSFQLQSAIDRIGKDPDGPGRDAAARELGNLALADQVLLVVAKKGAGEKLDASALRLDVKDGHNYAYQSGELPSDPKGISDWVNSLLASDSPRDGKKAVGHFTGASASGGGGGGVSGARVGGIILLCGAGLAAVSWGVFGYSALQQADQYRRTPQIATPQSRNAAQQGRLFSIVADVSWAVGAVMLVVGVLLAFTPLFGGSSGGSSSSTGSRGGGAKPPPEDDAMRAYRQHQEEQRRLDEERAQKAKEAPAEEPKPEEKKPEEKKPEEKAEPAKPPPEEKEKKKTPAEERAEKKRKAEEEKAEKKRKAEEEKAEKKRLAEEAKKKAAEEKAEKKRKAEEEKQKAEDDKKRAAEEKKQKAEEPKQKADDKKPDDEKKHKEEDQKKADEAEAKKADEERKKKEEEQKKREAEEEAKQRGEQEPPVKKQPKSEEDDLRNF